MKKDKITDDEIKQNLKALLSTAFYFSKKTKHCKEILKSIGDYLIEYGSDTVEQKPSVINMDYLAYLIKMKKSILTNNLEDTVHIVSSLDRRYNILQEPVKSGILLLLNDL